MTLKTLAAAASISLATAFSASAATFDVVGSFSGGQLGDVSFDLTIDADFSADIGDTSSGLTIKSLTSSVIGGDPFPLAGGLGYHYSAGSDELTLGGFSQSVRGIILSDTDFLLSITGFSTGTNAKIEDGLDSLQSIQIIDTVTSGTLTVTDVSAVPLPAGGLLLLTGFAGVAALKRRKQPAA